MAKQRRKKLPVLTWRPKAPSKQQRHLRALHSHHRADRDPNKVCAKCGKNAVLGSDYCAHHRSLLILHTPGDLVVYGK